MLSSTSARMLRRAVANPASRRAMSTSHTFDIAGSFEVRGRWFCEAMDCLEKCRMSTNRLALVLAFRLVSLLTTFLFSYLRAAVDSVTMNTISIWLNVSLCLSVNCLLPSMAQSLFV